MSPTVSVLIPTNRPGGLELAKVSLATQTFTDFEVIVGAPEKLIPTRGSYPSKWHFVIDDFEGGFWSLNRIYNHMFAAAQGDLLVTLQDFIKIPNDGLARFVAAHEKTGGAITGVGNAYTSLEVSDLSTVICWEDPRIRLYPGISLRQCRAIDHEWNYACMPAKDIHEVGGMDETLDFLGYGCDNVSVNERLRDVGVPFFLDPLNRIFAVEHSRKDDWKEHHLAFNGLYMKRRSELKAEGRWPRLHFPSNEKP